MCGRRARGAAFVFFKINIFTFDYKIIKMFRAMTTCAESSRLANTANTNVRSGKTKQWSTQVVSSGGVGCVIKPCFDSVYNFT